MAQDPATLYSLTAPDSKRSSSQLTTPMEQYLVQHLPKPEPYTVDVRPKPNREIVHKHMCKRVQAKRCESRQESGQPYLKRDLCYKRRPQSQIERQVLVKPALKRKTFVYPKTTLYRVKYRQPGIAEKGCLLCGYDNPFVDGHSNRYICAQSCIKQLKLPTGESV